MPRRPSDFHFEPGTSQRLLHTTGLDTGCVGLEGPCLGFLAFQGGRSACCPHFRRRREHSGTVGALD